MLTAVLLLAFVPQPAVQDVRPIEKLDVRIVCREWGKEMRLPAMPRYELVGHKVHYYVGPRRITSLDRLGPVLDEAAGVLVDLPRGRGQRPIMIKTGPGVTVRDVAEVVDVARRAGFDSVLLAGPEGTRKAPGRRGVPRRREPERPVALALARFESDQAADILLPAAKSAVAPARGPRPGKPGWIDPVGRTLPVVRLRQVATIEHGDHTVKLSAKTQPELLEFLRQVATSALGRKPDVEGKGEVPDGALVLRADQWVEFHWVAKLATMSAELGFTTLYLGVGPRPK